MQRKEILSWLEKVVNTQLENEVISIFRASKNNYGSRKIKVELKKKKIVVSRRKIREIMDKYRIKKLCIML